MTTLHTPSHRYVTRTVHSIQHQLVQIHPLHRTRVDRLHSTTHDSPTPPNCDFAQNSDRSNVPFNGRFFSKCPLVMCSYLANTHHSYVQQQLLTVLGLSEEPTTTTSHRNHLVPFLTHTHRSYLDESTREQTE